MHRSEITGEASTTLSFDRPQSSKKLKSARGSVQKPAKKMPKSDGPAFYSHTDIKKASKRLQGGSRKNRLYDGAVREIEYVNQTTRGMESYDVNK